MSLLYCNLCTSAHPEACFATCPYRRDPVERAVGNSPPPLDDVGDDVSFMLDETVGRSLEQTLAERGARYGDFSTHAEIAQKLKDVVLDYGVALRPLHREALDIIMHKIARILNGDPEYTDSWHDIAGYAKLVEDRCKPEG